MAVVKVTTTRKTGRTWTTNRRSIKASVRYIMHRPDRVGERGHRELFNEWGNVTKADAYRMIDEAGWGKKFVRMVISPDPKREDGKGDLSLRALTIKTMTALAQKHGRGVQFIAAVHQDHTDVRHIHVIAVVDKPLSYRDFKTLRFAATRECSRQRRQLDQSVNLARSHGLRSGQKRAALYTAARQEALHTRTIPARAPTCPRCGAGQPLKRIGRARYFCPDCRLRMSRHGLGITIEEKQAELELKLERK